MDILISNIVWDTDGEEVDLPTSVMAHDIDDVDRLADWLSDEYGWCVSSLDFDVVS